MMHKLTLFSLSISLCSATALAQSNPQPNTTSGPSAWVYVSSAIGTTNTYEVHGFTAASDGRLSPIAGSPFPANITDLAVNGAYVFGTPRSESSVEAYKIESNGSIHYNASTPVDKYQCNLWFGPIVLDHTGSSLYGMYFDNTCGNYAIAAWNIVKSNGSLKFLDTAGSDDGLIYPPTFTANDQYAYTAGCYRLGPEVYGFKRNSDGSLTQMSFNNPLPKAPSGEDYCPWSAVADPSNHLIVPVQPYSGYDGPLGPWQLAIYTVQSNGSLTTNSTYSNMPKLSGNFNTMRLSPSGKLLAVSTANGLKIYHFNGSQITADTSYISTVQFDSLQWDKNNHLYALSYNSNRLTVFTVTPTSWKWVASYTINKPAGLAVQPLPLPWQ